MTRLAHTIVPLLMAVASCVGPRWAWAQADGDASGDEIRRYAESYTGVHTGFGVIGGPIIYGNDPLDDTLGLAVGTEVQLGLVLHSAIFNLDYLHARTTAQLDDEPLDISTHSISLSVAINPIVIVGNLALLLGGAYQLVSGLYAQIGTSLVSTTYEGAGLRIDEDWGVTWHLGGGLDIPIGSPDGGGVWAGIQYRLTFFPSTLPALEQTERDLAQHAFLVSLAYRVNALPF